jgi:hypothetical protein
MNEGSFLILIMGTKRVKVDVGGFEVDQRMSKTRLTLQSSSTRDDRMTIGDPVVIDSGMTG